MSGKMENGIFVDRKHWPKNGTMVPATPADLADLWGTYEEQASVFVAEALIEDPPQYHLSLEEDKPILECFLWTVGNDCLMGQTDLCQEIESAATDYDKIRGPGQADDLKQRLRSLGKLEMAISNAKKVINDQLNDWELKK